MIWFALAVMTLQEAPRELPDDCWAYVDWLCELPVERDECWETFTHADGNEYVRYICPEPEQVESDNSECWRALGHGHFKYVCEGDGVPDDPATKAYREAFQCCIQTDIALSRTRFDLTVCRDELERKPLPFTFMHCFTGPRDLHYIYLHVKFHGCSRYDVDGDSDIDLQDFGAYQNVFE